MTGWTDKDGYTFCPQCDGRGFDPAGSPEAETNPNPDRTCSLCDGNQVVSRWVAAAFDAKDQSA